MFGTSDVSLLYALAYSLLGMIIVFVMLIALWAIVAIMAKLLNMKAATATAAAPSVAAPKPAATQPAVSAPSAQAAPESVSFRETAANRYKVTLLDKIYEVEIEEGEAVNSGASAAFRPAVPSPAPAASKAPEPVARPAQAPQPAPAVQPSPASQQTFSAGGEVVTAPLPGTVFKLNVLAGERVKSGQLLLILEAMKMENEILSPRDGTVSQIMVATGATVTAGQSLLALE